MSEYRKVNWYNEELDKFYDTVKDNKGLIWGVYYLENEDVIDVEWFKTEDERDKIVSNINP